MARGATKERSIFKTVIPAAKSGVMSGIILGMGRAIGETMAVVMVAGNQAIIPDSITSGVRTLTANIVLEMAYATGLHRRALIATAVVLFVFVVFLLLLFSPIGPLGEVITSLSNTLSENPNIGYIINGNNVINMAYPTS